MLRTFTLALVVASLTAACSGPARPEFGKADIDALRKLSQDLVTGYNAKDPAKTAALFAGNGVLMPPNSSIVRGTDAIQTFYEKRFQQGATGLQITPEEITGQGELAYLSGSYEVRTAPAGGTEMRDRGKFLWVARKMQPGWRWEYQMWSSDLDHPVAN